MKPTKDRTKLAAVWLPADVMRDKHHKRECTYSRVIHYDDGSAEVDESCICDRLQACEQRVIDDTTRWEPHYVAGQAHGYAAGLDAAREAVAAVVVRKDTSHDMRVQALAAIDALREEQK